MEYSSQKGKELIMTKDYRGNPLENRGLYILTINNKTYLGQFQQEDNTFRVESNTVKTGDVSKIEKIDIAEIAKAVDIVDQDNISRFDW